MRQFFLFTILALLVEPGSLDPVLHKEWKDYKVQHGKKYEDPTEESMRLKLFQENRMLIDKHNQRFEKGMETFKLAVNQFTDLLNTELKQITMDFNYNQKKQIRGSTFISPAYSTLPKSVDWRSAGAVTPVKHQGYTCSSCWAFATTAALESQNFWKTGKLIPLSEQQLIDCSVSYGNDGCNGGTMEKAMSYLQDSGGISTEESYPYKGVDGNCQFNSSTLGATSSGFVEIPNGDEQKLAEAVAFFGPVYATLDSSQKSFHLYSTGTYYDPACTQNKHNHAALIVGFGTDELGHDFWLVKNSWGTDWGLEGYFKMRRNANNHCGIASNAIYPLV